MTTDTTTDLQERFANDWSAFPYMEDPYPYLGELRAGAPVFWTPDDLWYVTPYEFVAEILRNPRLFSSDHIKHSLVKPDPYILDPAEGLWSRVFASILTLNDGEVHRRLRKLVSGAFTTRAIESYADKIRTAISSQLDAAMDESHEMDFKKDFSLPMPTRVILDLFGFDPKEAGRFYDMTYLFIPPVQEERPTPEEHFRSANALIEEHMPFVIDSVDKSRQSPGSDLISQIVQAGEDGDQLNDVEAMGMIMFLVVAGYETTANQLANGVYLLIQHPDQLRAVRDDFSLLPRAIEEIMRFEASVPKLNVRYATEDVQLGETTIHRGERVIGSIAAANRDPEAFAEPDAFDIFRERDNAHFAFAKGPHVCLGQWLARMEMKVALETIITRMPEIELAGDPKWMHSFYIRGLDSLPVRW